MHQVCGRCVAACAEIEGPGVLAFQFENGRLTVGTHNGLPLNQTDCVSCGQCVRACPCGALDYVRERGGVFTAINDPTKTVVGFVAPAVRSVIAAEFGIPFDQASAFIAGMMRKIGFDKAFDFAFAADLTIMEETTEPARPAHRRRRHPAVHLLLPRLGEPGRAALAGDDPAPVEPASPRSR